MDDHAAKIRCLGGCHKCPQHSTEQLYPKCFEALKAMTEEEYKEATDGGRGRE